jgi:hypothetical protein
MKNLKQFVLLFLITVVSLSCQTDEDVKLLPGDILTAGTSKNWKLISYKVDGVEKFNECAKDDIFTFSKKTSEYNWDIGAIKCFDGDINQKFSFSLSTDNKILIINKSEWKIIKLDNTTLQIEIFMSSNKTELVYVPIK